MNRTSLSVLAAALVSLSLQAADATRIRVARLPLGGETAAQSLRAEEPSLDTAALARQLRSHLVPHAPPRLASSTIERTKVRASAIGPRLGVDVRVEYRPNGTPLEIRGPVLRRPVMMRAAGAQRDDVATARAFLRENAPLMRLDDPDGELAVTKQVTDELGLGHIRFQQRFRGLEVWPAEVIVHLDRNGSVDLVDGAYVPTPRRVATRPLITAQSAIARARTAAGGGDVTVPELIVHAQSSRRPRLAWKLDVTSSLIDRWTVVIDATSGAVLTRFRRTHTSNVPGSGRDLEGVMRNINVWSQNNSFYMLDSTKKMFDPTSQTPSPQKTRGGIFVIDALNQPATNEPKDYPSGLAVVKSSSPTSWPVPDTISAAYLLSETYDYFFERHGRNGIDGKGGTLTAIVRLGKRFENAFWDGEQQLMVFGDGDLYAGSLDVISHEMAHGVTDNSANLVYQDQSGALNEAMSDIFGEMTEARSRGSNDWVLGSQLKSAIRDMKNPARFNDPAKMSQYVKTTSDNGGVHTNSGIINRAYYLLAEGLPSAIGLRDAEKIFYRALTQHLTKNSQFIDARVAAINAANTLFGANSNQAKKTSEAFDGVEIFGSTATPKEPDIPVVNGSDSTLFVFRHTTQNAYFLGRRELQSDGVNGATITRFDVALTRPSVTASGALALFVDSIDDVCLIKTDGSAEEECLDLPSDGVRVASVAMSPDGTKFAFVLLDANDEPFNEIVVVDTTAETEVGYEVSSPDYDGETIGDISFADAMTFTPDNRYLVFDAFNALQTDGEAWGAWSIYALALKSGQTFSLVPPIAGFDIGWPQLGHTSSDFLTFEAFDAESGVSSVVAANLDNGDMKIVAEEKGVAAVPSYTGDDRAIVFAVPASSPTGSSLQSVQLAADRITPTGAPTSWMSDASFPVVYRRGTYAGPSTQAGTLSFTASSLTAPEGSNVTVSVRRSSGNKGNISVNYATANGSAIAGSDYVPSSGTLTWLNGDMDSKTFTVRLLSDAVPDANETLVVSLSSPAGATIGTPAQLSLAISDVAGSAVTPTGKRRSTGR